MTLSAQQDGPRLTRWCYWCGGAVTSEGSHGPDGRFDQYGVYVDDVEMDNAMRDASQHRNPERVRFNIAFGKHIGSYWHQGRGTFFKSLFAGID